MKKQVVKTKNALGLKLWVNSLGYRVKDLAGQGFTARLEDRELMKQIKKSQHFLRQHFCMVLQNHQLNSKTLLLRIQLRQIL